MTHRKLVLARSPSNTQFAGLRCWEVSAEEAARVRRLEPGDCKSFKDHERVQKAFGRSLVFMGPYASTPLYRNVWRVLAAFQIPYPHPCICSTPGPESLLYKSIDML